MIYINIYIYIYIMVRFGILFKNKIVADEALAETDRTTVRNCSVSYYIYIYMQQGIRILVCFSATFNVDNKRFSFNYYLI